MAAEPTFNTPIAEADPATRLLNELTHAGVELSVKGSQLRFKAPRGVLSPDRKRMLLECKERLIALVRERLDHALIPAEHSAETEAAWEPYGHQATMVEDPDVRNILCPVRWQGVLDASTVQTAFEALLARHSVLRTRYARAEDGRVLALTEKRLAVPLSIIDLRYLPPQLRESTLRRIASRPFDLYKGPVVAHYAVRLKDDTTACLVIVHHSICDAVSAALVSDDLRALLVAAASGSPASLPPLPMEFRDFARERSRWLKSEEARPHVEFWYGVLSRCGSICRLPYDRRTPPDPGFLRPGVGGSLSAATVASLRALAAAEKSTMSVLFSALVAVVLSRWTGSTEVTAWICDVGRSRPELYRLVGCFVNHWLLRADLSGDPDFVDILRRVHTCHVEAAPHLDVTIHRLIAEMRRSEACTLHPAVIINFMPFARHAGLTSSSPPPARQALSSGYSKNSPLAMDISCRESLDELAWVVEYSSHLFEDTTAQRFSLALTAIAESLARDPRLRMSLLPPQPIATPSDRRAPS